MANYTSFQRIDNPHLYMSFAFQTSFINSFPKYSIHAFALFLYNMYNDFLQISITIILLSKERALKASMEESIKNER